MIIVVVQFNLKVIYIDIEFNNRMIFDQFVDKVDVYYVIFIFIYLDFGSNDWRFGVFIIREDIVRVRDVIFLIIFFMSSLMD